jgi:hypothetical protein
MRFHCQNYLELLRLCAAPPVVTKCCEKFSGVVAACCCTFGGNGVLPNFFKVLIEYLETPGTLQPTIFGPFIEQTTTTTSLLPHLEMDNDFETARCSGCKRNNLPVSNFPWGRPGVRYKTCNRCRTSSNARDRDQKDQEPTAGNQIAQRWVEQEQETIAAGQTTRQADQG